LQVNRFRCYDPGLPARIPGSLFARNLIERRTLIIQLVKRDFHQRYIGSSAGWVWGLIHPLVLLASYTFVFDIVMKSGQENYPLVLFAGMLPWLLFAETVQRSSGSLVEQANLITKTMFPSEIVPVSVFLSLVISHVLSVILFAVVAGLIVGHMNPMLVFLPLFVVFLGLFAIGLGWIAGALQVYLRDTAQVVTVVMTFWMWVTPIFLAESKFPDRFRVVIRANPMAYVVRGYREMILGQKMPALSDLGWIAVFGTTTFVIGGLFFRSLKRGFADVL
jgi:lipopolysaccharide transport system permease protein